MIKQAGRKEHVIIYEEPLQRCLFMPTGDRNFPFYDSSRYDIIIT